jgi:drug/metabolite transporter (DMT)-like permease
LSSTVTALGLVVCAAVLHAAWNVLAKRAQGGLAFTWLTFALSCICYLPVIAWVYAVARPHLNAVDWLFIAGNAATHAVYFFLLRRGYAAGDLSLVYPIARGTGPLVSSLAAVVLFAERPGALGFTGLALIVGGIFFGCGDNGERDDVRERRISIAYGLATGVSIAAYTLWDKYSVSTLAIAPIVYDFWGNVGRTIAVAPFVATRVPQIRDAWQRYRREALGIAILSPIAYLLVLWALVTTPVSLVAPAREISIVFGTILGIRVFGERAGRRRIMAAGMMFAGIVALAVG